ncbi:MAG: hypothetical protein K2H01_03820 [Ruminococcus sp.]|nr:hypothetical protein [Ruminococcus sp.]
MSAIKKIFLAMAVIVMAASLFGCSGDKENDDTSASSEQSSSADESVNDDNSNDAAFESDTETEDATVQANIPLEYDGTDVNDSCADTINKYFTAIINQRYDDYVDTLDPYYFSVYNSWLDGNYGYGMETSFETMHQNLMNAAVSANNDKDVNEVRITKLKLSPTVPKDGEEDGAVINDYLAQYDTLIGEGFTEELKKQCDDVLNVTFTMTADCDGTELEILKDMELLMTVSDGEYRILG